MRFDSSTSKKSAVLLDDHAQLAAMLRSEQGWAAGLCSDFLVKLLG
jgi:hypothetical protein